MKEQTISSWDDHEKTEEQFFKAFKGPKLTPEEENLVCDGEW